MVLEMIRAEWERRRAVLAGMVALYLALPALNVYSLAGAGPEFGEQLRDVRDLSAPVITALAAAALAWGMGSWAAERKGRWVYALSLPVERTRLFAAKYAAALLCLAAPVGALWTGSQLAALAVERPAGVYAYPGAVTVWVGLFTWFLFTAGFFLAAAFDRPGRALAIPAALLVALMVATGAGWLPVVERAADLVVESPASPFRLADPDPVPWLFGY